jgi:predicted DCC family thiol-disulfide oxidoreductase YuxK
MRGDEILTRSAAVMDLLDTLGGVWRAAAAIAAIFPEKLLDLAYEALAARRYRWFGRKTEACPLLPPDLRSRIEA